MVKLLLDVGGNHYLPSELYVLVTNTSFVGFGMEDVCDTCFRRLSAN